LRSGVILAASRRVGKPLLTLSRRVAADAGKVVRRRQFMQNTGMILLIKIQDSFLEASG
jgi:hypothetical protein